MTTIQLMYVSSAQAELDTEVLRGILQSSVRHNGEQQVTGMLLLLNGSFMQVLEGPERAVDEKYGRIHDDRRHTGLRLIEFRHGFDPTSLGANKGFALETLKSFSRNQGL